MTNSLESLFKEITENTIEDRIKQWANYYFEKELLPSLIREIVSKIRIEIYENANIPEEIKIKVRFDATEIYKGKKK